MTRLLEICLEFSEAVTTHLLAQAWILTAPPWLGIVVILVVVVAFALSRNQSRPKHRRGHAPGFVVHVEFHPWQPKDDVQQPRVPHVSKREIDRRAMFSKKNDKAIQNERTSGALSPVKHR